MASERVVVIGAGIGGLVAALLLAAHGLDVTLVEKAERPGGKMREVVVAHRRLDAGPTVLTMRWVFDQIFAEAGSRLEEHLGLRAASTLARHAWSEDERLDLFAERAASADAISAFAGPAEGRNYLAFCAKAGAVHDALRDSFMSCERPSMLGLAQKAGLAGLAGLSTANPFATLWSALGKSFADRRLRQLFARYATYCGSSPFEAPATLMLVAHVEQEGVWLVEGGMWRLADALARLAEAKGATLRFGVAVQEIVVAGGRAVGVGLADGETLFADAVLSNADVNALATGRFGADAAPAAVPVPAKDRSLSALTWAAVAETAGVPLLRHNVFFSPDYEAEFTAIRTHRRLPADPTVYVCAQDRDDMPAPPDGPERLLLLVNAPPVGDGPRLCDKEIETCLSASLARLEQCGVRLRLDSGKMLPTQPADWERLYPATGGALYGRATHGAMASFTRPGSRSRLPGLYLTGGGVHPGPGVPMVALSGRIATQAILEDLASRSRSRRAATPGGISTR